MRMLLLVCCFQFSICQAQTVDWSKLSPMLRQLVRSSRDATCRVRGGQRPQKDREVCALIRVTDQPDEVFAKYGCRELTRVDDISIASIPISQLAAMSRDRRVGRIASGPSGHVLCDSMAVHLNAQPVYAGTGLPQAFTGRGVVMGLMDIGFDLTHPTFYDATGTHYRIRRFWDMLSADTVGSPLYVGRDYQTREALLALGHSRDGCRFWHGTGTLGIAAGSGYQSPYRGMAPESDICIVANAVSDDLEFIDPADYEKYTYATDAMGFKYIFDYADSIGQPCVISFSEGSSQDFWGYDLLYYELIDKMVGPGHIIVSAAGNRAHKKFWFRKPAGQPSEGTFLYGERGVDGTLKSAQDFTLRFVAYGDAANDTLLIDTRDVQSRDSLLLCDTLTLCGIPVSLMVEGYPSCYDSTEVCYDFLMQRVGGGSIGSGSSFPVSLEVVGREADVEFWKMSASLITSPLNPRLCAGDGTHTIMSPASSPSIICVGSTFYRAGIENDRGQWQEYEHAQRGRRVEHSSMGPTMDGRIKPDVMAPGANIIQPYSSYFLENNPMSPDDDWSVEHFTFQGRNYAWTANSGTSSASPAVGGAIALWLQANPRLTPADILDVIARTSSHPDPSLSYPNNEYGYGQIDVYRGLLDILQATGIEGISTVPTPARITVQGHRLHIGFPSPIVKPVRLRLYALSGQKLLDSTLPANQSAHTILLPATIPPGIVVVQIDGDASCRGSQLVRISSDPA